MTKHSVLVGFILFSKCATLMITATLKLSVRLPVTDVEIVFKQKH